MFSRHFFVSSSSLHVQSDKTYKIQTRHTHMTPIFPFHHFLRGFLFEEFLVPAHVIILFAW